MAENSDLQLLRCVCESHHVVEDEARVGQLEVLDQAVEFPAVERAPGTVQVVSGLRLLPSVVVILELHRRRHTFSSAHWWGEGEVR